MDINKDNRDSIFVELIDNGFKITPVIEDDFIRIEIRESAYQNNRLLTTDFFRYDEIAEQVSVFVDYMKEVCSNTYVNYNSYLMRMNSILMKKLKNKEYGNKEI